MHREVLRAEEDGLRRHLRRAALVGGRGRGCVGGHGRDGLGGELGPAFSHRRHGLRDLTHTLTTTFPAFAPGEEAVRRTVVTIEADGYYMQEWRGSSSTSAPTSTPPATSPRAGGSAPSCACRS